MSAADDSPPVSAPPQPSTDSSTVATQRHMWQIFTDENGDVQRQQVAILKNPFESEDTIEPPVGGNPFTETQTDLTTGASEGDNTSASVVPHQTLPPPKPRRTVAVYQNGGSKPAAKSSRVESGGQVVVFETDKTYTRFDNVDEDESEEEELGYPIQPKPAEEHHTTSKTLIRSDSDLMLPYIQSRHGNPMGRVWRWWTQRHIVFKVVVLGTLMSLAYLFIVLIIVHSLS